MRTNVWGSSCLIDKLAAFLLQNVTHVHGAIICILFLARHIKKHFISRFYNIKYFNGLHLKSVIFPIRMLSRGFNYLFSISFFYFKTRKSKQKNYFSSQMIQKWENQPINDFSIMASLLCCLSYVYINII
jgi:hypothetical protein